VNAVKALYVIVSVFSLLVFGCVGLADWDPPGPPPLQVLIAAEGVRFPEIPDDGLNGKSELVLVIVARSTAGRAVLQATATLDLESTRGVWDLNLADQLGFECSPPSRILLLYSLTELDNGGQEVLGGVLLSLSRAAMYLWNPALAAGNLAAGVVASYLLPHINGHDNLGSGGMRVDGDVGDFLVEMKGPDGSAQVHLRTIVNEVADTGQCGAPDGEGALEEVPTGEPPTQEKVGRVYEPLYDVYWKIAELQGEGGTRRLSRAQLDRIQRTYMSLLLRSAASVALDYLMQALWEGRDAAAIREAWDQFLRGEQYAQAALWARGQEARDVNMDRALTAYERAAKAAARALSGSSSLQPKSLASVGRAHPSGAFRPAGGWQGLPTRPGNTSPVSQTTGSGFEPSLYLHLLPDYLAVKADSTPAVVAWAVGGEGEVELSVAGAPAGMEWSVEPLGEVPGLFAINLDAQGVPSGHYELTLTATRGGESVSRKLTLWVED